MRTKYEGRANFLIVYIKEAHPEDEWQQDANVEAGIIFNQPETTQERMEMAQTFVEKMNVKIPILVDEIANPVNACYAAWPERLYVVSQDGVIVYKNDVGPAGFKPEELDEFLDSYLKES